MVSSPIPYINSLVHTRIFKPSPIQITLTQMTFQVMDSNFKSNQGNAFDSDLIPHLTDLQRNRFSPSTPCKVTRI